MSEWPNAYRVVRVYKDRLEAEVRLVPNLGLVCESYADRGLSYALSTHPGDLCTVIPYRGER